MAKGCEEILEQMRRTKAGWKASDFEKLYTGFGFEEKGSGRDTKYVHRTYKQLFASVSRGSGELATGYSSTAVKLIDRLKMLEADSKNV